MKKLIAAILLAVTLTGCIEQPVSTSYHTVQSIVTKASRRRSGGHRKYYVHVSYKDITKRIKSKSLYKEYKNDIGQTIDVVLVRHTYEDGTVKEEIYKKD